LICPECGSYQPNRAKFCGICGSPLSQEGLLESFFKKGGEGEFTLPRHRSPLFYMVITLILILSIALLAGAAYLVYLVAWGEKKEEGKKQAVEENTKEYFNPEIGFSLSYPDNWTMDEDSPGQGELASLAIWFSSRKRLELKAYQLDPVVTIGGLEGISEFLSDDAEKRILSFGGAQPGASGAGTSDSRAGSPPGEPETEEAENGGAADFLVSGKVGALPAFYCEFNANVLGEETRFLLYYIVADDYLFTFLGRAPAAEYKDVRPLFMAIAGSFKWERAEEVTPPGGQPLSVR